MAMATNKTQPSNTGRKFMAIATTFVVVMTIAAAVSVWLHIDFASAMIFYFAFHYVDKLATRAIFPFFVAGMKKQQ